MAHEDGHEARLAGLGAWPYGLPSVAAGLKTHEDLVAALRAIDGLRDKGKVHPTFHFRSRPFLHFHRGERGLYADVRFAEEFEPVPAETEAERAALLQAVSRHVEVSRRR